MSNHNGQDDHPHVPAFDPSFLSTPARRRYRPSSPADHDEGPNPHFMFQSNQVLSLLDIDVANGVRSYPDQPTPATAASASTTAAYSMSAEEQLAKMAELNAAQQKQMDAANLFANRQAEQLLDSQRQLQAAQQQIEKR